MAIQYTEEFKINAVKYWNDHQDLGIGKCAKNLGISKSALSNWGKPIQLMTARSLQEGVVISKATMLRK